MNFSDPLVVTLVYLAAMVVTVPLARKLGLGTVLGYLVAGVVLGPGALAVIGSSQEQVLHIAEFGVIMMLFLIGLELQPSLLWKLRMPIFGLGGLQVVSTATAIFALGLALGAPWQSAVAAGMILSLSSTAIVLQTLQEKGALKTTGGEAAFSVLLFQDVAVIPMLAVFPLLALHASGGGDAALAPGGESASAAGAWLQAGKILLAIGAVILTGKFLARPVFHMVGASRLRELFTAVALLLVVGVTLLMHAVGLSPALGAFLGGVVLADSEYRHQLETDIEPFKGLLLAVFFISVGAGIDLGIVRSNPGFIAAVIGAIVVLKWIVLYGVARIGRLRTPDALLFSFSLAQGGEFAFVLLGLAGQKRIFAPEITQALTASVALSMLSAPILIQSYLRFIQPRFAQSRKKREPDTIDEHESTVIVLGFGRFGQMVVRLLRGAGFQPTVLDYDADQIEVLRRFGMKGFFGDASSMDLLRSAGAAQARLLVVAIDDAAKTLQIIDAVKKEFPALKILARAYDRIQAYEMIHRGIEHPYIETSGSALALGTEALKVLGFPAKQALHAAQIFNRHNDASIRELAKMYHEADEATFLTHARNWTTALEGTLRADDLGLRTESDRAWESAPRRQD